MSSVVVDTSVKTGKLSNINGGNGYKIKINGDKISKVEFLYGKPSFAEKYGVSGLTFVNFAGVKRNGNYGSIFRLEWDPKDGYHRHYKP